MCCLTSMNRRGPTTTCCPASSAICCADSTVASNRARNSNAPPSCPATRASASCCCPRRATAPDAYTPAPLPPAGEGGAQRRVRVWLFVRQLACQIRNDLPHPPPNPSPASGSGAPYWFLRGGRGLLRNPPPLDPQLHPPPNPMIPPRGHAPPP